MDSISATTRLKRWDANESIPDSLQSSAKLLDKRLEAANKLSSTHFVGSPLVVSRLNGISDAIRRLDRACTEYKSRVEQEPSQLIPALDAPRWRGRRGQKRQRPLELTGVERR